MTSAWKHLMWKLFTPLQNAVFHLRYHFRTYLSMVFKVVMRILGPVMILGANVLIAGVVYAFLWHVVPDLCGGNHLHFLAHVLVGFYLLGNIVFNYIACISTSPGHPEPCHDPIKYLGGKTSVTAEGKKLLHFNHQVLLEPAVSYRWCRHCKCIKPPRAHHDSVSGRCVLDMDHYWCVLGLSTVWCLCVLLTQAVHVTTQTC